MFLFISSSFRLSAGLIECEGKLWREQRRFSVHTLSTFGSGKRSIEIAMNIELARLAADIEALSEGGTQPVDPAALMLQASANVIAILVFGEKLSEQADFRRVCDRIKVCLSGMDLHPLVPILGECAIFCTKYFCY